MTESKTTAWHWGEWAEWGPWVCTTTCGKGLGMRRRSCKGEHSADLCGPGWPVEVTRCRGKPCPTSDTAVSESPLLPKDLKSVLRQVLENTKESILKNEGEKAELTVSLKSFEKVMEAYKESYVMWMKNGEIFEINPSRMKAAMRTINIYNLVTNDSGIYVAYMNYSSNLNPEPVSVKSLVVIPANYQYEVRVGEVVNVLCNGLFLAELFPNKTYQQKWLLNREITLKEYEPGITLDKNSDKIVTDSTDQTGIWTCEILTKGEKWVTNAYNIKVLTRLTWQQWLVTSPWAIAGLVGAILLLFVLFVSFVAYKITKTKEQAPRDLEKILIILKYQELHGQQGDIDIQAGILSTTDVTPEEKMGTFLPDKHESIDASRGYSKTEHLPIPYEDIPESIRESATEISPIPSADEVSAEYSEREELLPKQDKARRKRKRRRSHDAPSKWRGAIGKLRETIGLKKKSVSPAGRFRQEAAVPLTRDQEEDKAFEFDESLKRDEKPRHEQEDVDSEEDLSRRTGRQRESKTFGLAQETERRRKKETFAEALSRSAEKGGGLRAFGPSMGLSRIDRSEKQITLEKDISKTGHDISLPSSVEDRTSEEREDEPFLKRRDITSRKGREIPLEKSVFRQRSGDMHRLRKQYRDTGETSREKREKVSKTRKIFAPVGRDLFGKLRRSYEKVTPPLKRKPPGEMGEKTYDEKLPQDEGGKIHYKDRGFVVAPEPQLHLDKPHGHQMIDRRDVSPRRGLTPPQRRYEESLDSEVTTIRKPAGPSMPQTEPTVPKDEKTDGLRKQRWDEKLQRVEKWLEEGERTREHVVTRPPMSPAPAGRKPRTRARVEPGTTFRGGLRKGIAGLRHHMSEESLRSRLTSEPLPAWMRDFPIRYRGRRERSWEGCRSRQNLVDSGQFTQTAPSMPLPQRLHRHMHAFPLGARSVETEDRDQLVDRLLGVCPQYASLQDSECVDVCLDPLRDVHYHEHIDIPPGFVKTIASQFEYH